MKTATREFGIVGLGRMGGGLVLQAGEEHPRRRLRHARRLYRANRRWDVEVLGLDGLRGQLAPPRAVFLSGGGRVVGFRGGTARRVYLRAGVRAARALPNQ